MFLASDIEPKIAAVWETQAGLVGHLLAGWPQDVHARRHHPQIHGGGSTSSLLAQHNGAGLRFRHDRCDAPSLAGLEMSWGTGRK